MTKVYVVQETNYDFAPAEQFGDVVFMSVNMRDDFFNVVDSENNKHLMIGLRAKLRNYDADNDYIVIAGSPYINATVFWLLGHMGIRKLRILRWDNRDLRYIPLILTLPYKETTDG